MDNLTHTLLGAAMSRTGLNRKMEHATLTLIIAANLPDVDIVTGGWGSVYYLKYHRGITHSMLGVTVLGLALAGIVFFLQKRAWRKSQEARTAPSFVWIGAICLLGTWSHLLLDLTNSYGVRPFMPFSGRWVAWDLEPIVDPAIWTILLCGLLLPGLFRLISEEVGERHKVRGRVGAWIAITLLVGWWGLRDVNHRDAVAKLSDFTYRGDDAVAVYALPRSTNPFRWMGVAETARAYFVVEVGSNFSASALSRARVFYKPEDSDILRAARETFTGRVFMNFARLPVYAIASRGENTVVTIRDLRFGFSGQRRGGFTASIEMTKDLKVVSQGFKFAG